MASMLQSCQVIGMSFCKNGMYVIDGTTKYVEFPFLTNYDINLQIPIGLI
jgi:hypothetical protein